MSHILPAIAFGLFIAAHLLALAFCTHYNRGEEARREDRGPQIDLRQSRSSLQLFADMRTHKRAERAD